MKTDYDPWSSIDAPANEGSLSRKRVQKVDQEVYWAKSSNNQFGVIVKLTVVASQSLLKKYQNSFENIHFFVLPDNYHMWIYIQDPMLKKQFRVLVHQVLSELEKNRSIDSGVAPLHLFQAFEKWSKLLTRKSKEKLSENAKRGLLGELYFLSRLLGQIIGIAEAVQAWCGPAGHEQDFNHKGILFEIKSQLASSDKVVKISSLEQLDTISGRIILSHFGLSPVEKDTADSISLESLTSEILDALKDNNYLTDVFYGLLSCLGVFDKDENLETAYRVSFQNHYEVSESFPAIKRSETALAITKLQYSLDMSNLQEFEKKLIDILEEAI